MAGPTTAHKHTHLNTAYVFKGFTTSGLNMLGDAVGDKNERMLHQSSHNYP